MYRIPIVVMLILIIPAGLRGQDNANPERGWVARHIYHFTWEMAAGVNLSGGLITAAPEGFSKQDYKSSVAPGFQLGLFPVIEISKAWSARTGLLLSSRVFSYEIQGSAPGRFSERSMLTGIPAYIQYRFGIGGLSMHIFSGLHFQYLCIHHLEYSLEPVPNYTQKGSLSLRFDRRHMVPDFHAGIGFRYQVSKYFIGAGLTYFLGLSNLNRYPGPRTAEIYDGSNPPFTYRAPGFRSHGLMLNLVIGKGKLL